VAGQSSGWYKTGTTEKCVPDSVVGEVNGGSPDMTFGTGYAPASEKIQPLGPYSDVFGEDGRNDNYDGYAGNCPITSSGCSEYIDPDPSIYTNYLSPKDKGLEVSLQLPGYTLYNLTNATIAAATNSDCKVYQPFGVTSPMWYLSGGDDCQVTITAEGSGSLQNSKVSKAGVYYSLSSSVNNSSCNGSVDFPKQHRLQPHLYR
jgi:hypothetical protein